MLSSELLARGYSRHALGRALESGAVIRPRRGWIALPDADPALVFAARTGVLLSCITQARRLGLWVLAEEVPHFAARSPGSKPNPGRGVIHWSAPAKPRAPGELVDPVENVLGLVAKCRPHEEAKAIIESALNQRVIDLHRLRTVPFGAKMQRILDTVTPFSDSGLETYVKERLRWLPVSVRAQAWLHGHRVDFLIGERLVIQIDGGHHVGAQRSSDNRHDAELMLRGYHVIRIGYSDVIHHWPATQELILSAIARGAHLAMT